MAGENWEFLAAILPCGCSQNAPWPRLERLQQREALTGMDKLCLTFPIVEKGFPTRVNSLNLGELALSACKMSTKWLCQALSSWFPVSRSPWLFPVLSCHSASPSIDIPAPCVTAHSHLHPGHCSKVHIACPRPRKLFCFAEILLLLLQIKALPSLGLRFLVSVREVFQVSKGIPFYLKTTLSFNLALPRPSASDLHV